MITLLAIRITQMPPLAALKCAARELWPREVRHRATPDFRV